MHPEQTPTAYGERVAGELDGLLGDLRLVRQRVLSGLSATETAVGDGNVAGAGDLLAGARDDLAAFEARALARLRRATRRPATLARPPAG